MRQKTFHTVLILRKVCKVVEHIEVKTTSNLMKHLDCLKTRVKIFVMEQFVVDLIKLSCLCDVKSRQTLPGAPLVGPHYCKMDHVL